MISNFVPYYSKLIDFAIKQNIRLVSVYLETFIIELQCLNVQLHSLNRYCNINVFFNRIQGEFFNLNGEHVASHSIDLAASVLPLHFFPPYLAILRIFIKDPYYTSITKDEKIPFLTFIGNTGGLLGLSIGLSAVSIFEMFYHMIRYIFESCKLKCK